MTVTASVTGGSGTWARYTWYTSSYSYLGSGPVINNHNAGAYCVIANDSIGTGRCYDTICLAVTDTGTFNCNSIQISMWESDSCKIGDIYLNTWVYGGSGSYSYRWNTGATSQNLFNQTNGSFSVIVTDLFYGCKDTLYKTVVDDTCNICDIFKNGGYITENDPCQKNDITLSAIKWGGSFRYYYLWNTGATSQIINNKSSGSYWVKITDSLTGCIDTLFATVTDDTCNPCQNFYAYINENADSCQKNDVLLYAYTKDSNSLFNTYLWSNGATTSSITNAGTGTYWVKVTNAINGCIDTAYITVVDDTCNPCDNFSGYLWKRDSCQSNDIFVYSQVYGGSGNYSYIWSTGSTANFLTNRGIGWYKVTITDVIKGCIYKDSIYVVDSNFRCCKAWCYVNDNAISSTKIFYGYSNKMDSINGGTTTFTWNFGDGNTGAGQTKTHTFTSSGNKTVCLYISTASGCKDTFCSLVNAPTSGKNLKVSHYGIPYIKDTNRYTYITYQNIGTTTESGIVEYKYRAGMTLVSSTISPLTHVGNKISFSLGSLAPGASGTIYVVMKTPMSFTLGSIKCDTAIILPVSGDIVPTNNSSYECDSVVASWDPNDKTPNPKGIGPDGNIPPTTSEIGYLIRFENEGNWRTYRVRVEDEIDPSFDINSLMIGDASHAYRLVRKDNKLNWYFDDIELTPKSVNPDKSHGYIQYTLQLKPGLSLGTQLMNTAYIYFDANPAIITNTTKNTLKNTDGSSAVRNLASDDLLDFDLKRNGDKLTIFSPSKMQALRIFDISGKLLLENELNSDKKEIENVQLSQGIYIIHVDIDNQTVIKKFKF